MIIQEVQHPGEPSWLFRFGNWSSIDDSRVSSTGYAWMFKENDQWCFKPRKTGNASLFYNAVFFIRFSAPFGIFWSIRWSSSRVSKALWQAGLGWKLNGRLAVLFRIQSDATSAAGVTGQNFGQAIGFNYGPH